jgi:glyoxylase-like metal-dependent hydrolase (beta-lactamase superfamily II)
MMLAALLLHASAHAEPAIADAKQVPDIRPFIAREITPQVHLLTTPEDFHAFAIGNVLIIEQSDGLVLIDSGMTAAHGRAIARYARSLSAKPIKAVAITHWHNDHPQGVSAIREAFPKVRIIATRSTEEGMLGPEAFDIGYHPSRQADTAVAQRVAEEKKGFEALLADPSVDGVRKERVRKALAQFDDYVRDFRGSYIVPPTETFERQLSIADRSVPIRLMFLGRANTAGDLVAWLPNQKIVAAGDIVVSPWPFGFGSYPAEWIGTLKRLKALGFRTLVPGHGDPQSDASYLDRLIAAISDIRTQVGALARTGLPLDQVRKRVDFRKTSESFGETPRDKANFEGLFAEPMIENAYKEAKGTPILQGEGGPAPRFTENGPPSRAIHHKT